MELSVLIRGGGLFLAAFSTHWLLWRLRGAPKTPALSLSLHFLAFGAIYAMALSRSDGAAVLLLYVSLAAAYIQTMPLMMLRSPTLGLLLELGRAGPAGLSRRELVGGFDPDSLFSRRLEELLAARLVEMRPDGRLRATPRGKLCVPAFLVMRRVLGLPAGLG